MVDSWVSGKQRLNALAVKSATTLGDAPIHELPRRGLLENLELPVLVILGNSEGVRGHEKRAGVLSWAPALFVARASVTAPVLLPKQSSVIEGVCALPGEGR